MSVSVEHDKRKEEILDKALDVFVMEGYKDTTFQKIAERCGITRTILYLYFNNKKEIFSSCIKRFMGRLEDEIRCIAGASGKTSSEKIIAIGEMVVQLCATESKLLSIVLDYLLKLKMAGGDPDERVRRRTVRMRHILAMIIIEGKKKGEFASETSGKAASELFYALIEAAVFRIAVLGQKDASALSDSLGLLASSMRRKNNS
ncbi:MAG TPA: TetR/AcrR family transcriptional regulator [Rectinemataceae bacterium]|nr:TetR/AcrR family transcriptional regulator [Rectinemataceae bacterium]